MDEPTKELQHWKWKLFYYNTNDKRLFVPKRRPEFGITLNFAHRGSLVFSICFVVFVTLVIFFAFAADKK